MPSGKGMLERAQSRMSENSLGMNGSRVLAKSNLEASAAAATSNHSSLLSQISTVANQKKHLKIELKKRFNEMLF